MNPHASAYSAYRAFPPHWYYGPDSPANKCPPDQQYNTNKKRRQAAAGGVVQALWGSNTNENSTMGRKSTAQPRPVLNVPPGGIGPIADPNENDVLCGRGGRINSHVGNVQFRDIINSRKKEYLAKTTKKLEKAHIAAAIINDIRSMQPPGRFLKEDGKTGMWFDIGDAKAIKKTGQALREDAPEIRPDIDGEESPGDEKNDEAKKAAVSPKYRSKSPKARKSRPATSPNVAAQKAPTAFNGHGPQLLPGAWQNQNVEDHQGQAAMPPPFQAQTNPYIMQQRQAQGTFEPRSIPIQVPHNLYNMANHRFSGNKKGTHASKQATNALAPEDFAFGKVFHRPASAVGSERTNSTISALTDPAASNLSSLSGSGMHAGSNFPNLSPGTQLRRIGARESLTMGQLFPGDTGSGISGMSGISSAFGMASESFRPSDIAGSFQGSIARSSSFPDMSNMSNMSSIVDHDSWKRIMECDEEMEAPQSLLSSGSTRASNRVSGMSMMSIGSGTSSSQWMTNASLYDGRSILSEMSSDLNALDLAS